MKIELHMIQNFAPSCLNRDDTNSPKDCLFGGVRRARISSQCIKRAVRTVFRQESLLPPENLAHRTKRLAEEVASRLAAQGKDKERTHAAAVAAIGGLGLGVDSNGQTQYLLYLGDSGIDAMVKACADNWDVLAEVGENLKKPEEEASTKSAKNAKKAAKEAVTEEVRKSLAVVLDGSKAADLALFGRMLADLPEQNIDAACQVAHAISTNRVEMEMDFFTAVDDLQPGEEPGAGMMGVVGYNSSCFYRYAVTDFGQLVGNLGGDRQLAENTLEAFLRASATAIPTGKQNTFAAHNPPDFILAAVRHDGAPLSLANAFVQPAWPQEGKDLTKVSVEKMRDYWSKVAAVYGHGRMDGPFYCGLTTPDDADGWTDAGSFDSLVESVMVAVRKGAES